MPSSTDVTWPPKTSSNYFLGPVPQWLVLRKPFVGREPHHPARLLARDPAPLQAETAQKPQDGVRRVPT